MPTRVGLLVIWCFAALAAAAPSVRAEPALVTFGDDGVRIGTETVDSGKVDGALVDVYRDRLWYVKKKTLYVVVLDDDPWKPVAIAKNMPPGPWGIDGRDFDTAETGGRTPREAHQ